MTVVSLSKISEHFPFFHQPPPSVSRTFLKFLITRSSIWFSSLQVRKHRDVRPNDGFLRQLVEFDTRYCFPETLYEYTEVGTWALATSSDSFLTFQTTKRARTAGQHSSGLKWLWFDFSDLTSPPPAPPLSLHQLLQLRPSTFTEIFLPDLSLCLPLLPIPPLGVGDVLYLKHH